MISTKMLDGTCYAKVNGDLTIYTAAECHDLLMQAMQAGLVIEIDLSAVAEIDTAGVQLLVAAKRDSAAVGRLMRLVRHSPAVQEIIDLFQLAADFGDPMIMQAGNGTRERHA